MQSLFYGAAGVLLITFFVMLIFAFKSRKPIRLFLINAGIGFALFLAIDLSTVYTGMHLPINGWTAAGTAMYGAPAVVGFLLLQTLFL